MELNQITCPVCLKKKTFQSVEYSEEIKHYTIKCVYCFSVINVDQLLERKELLLRRKQKRNNAILSL